MAAPPNLVPHLAFTRDVFVEYNRLTGRFMARALSAGWDAAAADVDALEAATLATAGTVRDREAVRRFFRVFRDENVTRQ